jgi:hypothetical protein
LPRMDPRVTELRPLILLDLPATLDGFSERGEGAVTSAGWGRLAKLR